MSSLVTHHRRQRKRPSLAKSIEESWGNVADDSKGNEDNRERCQNSQLDDASGRDTQKEELFQHFYQEIQKEHDRERPSDCVIVSTNEEQREYATAIGHRLQDLGLVVEMIPLASESSLTRALQEVKHDGSPFCVIIQQPNVKFSSCTIVLLHESLRIHRDMPLEDALVLLAEEFRRVFTKREQRECAEIAQRASDLVDDFLARESLPSYSVPLGVRHLFFLLNEGKHLHKDELNLITDYLKTRKLQLKDFETPGPLARSEHSSFQGKNNPAVGKPPLLPTAGKNSDPGPAPPSPVKSSLLGDRPRGGLLPLPGFLNPNGLLSPPLLLWNTSLPRPPNANYMESSWASGPHHQTHQSTRADLCLVSQGVGEKTRGGRRPRSSQAGHPTHIFAEPRKVPPLQGNSVAAAQGVPSPSSKDQAPSGLVH
ncbi:nuclear receptor coactivator 5-like isoform X3 [Dasypus novemcinctus]|uniref:nuclear receptor coactivator 5-like isoform X3 n=1 Tax=Dasypus novemcinctus TaxID=9361 RepID=UPI000C859C2F|nr:nuclear receptor coactivator 5-like isoform X3 [Dasypus novemcinctus]